MPSGWSTCNTGCLQTTLQTSPQHLKVLKWSFGHPKQVNDNFLVPTLLDAQRLVEKSSFFKLSMLNNSQWLLIITLVSIL